MKICTKCGKQLADNALFCNACGGKAAEWEMPAAAPLNAPACPSCGAPVKSGAVFCTVCGAKLAAGSQIAPAVRPAPKPGTAAAHRRVFARRNKKWIYIGAAALALLLVFVFANGGGSEETAGYASGGYRSGSAGGYSAYPSNPSNPSLTLPDPFPDDSAPDYGITETSQICPSCHGSGTCPICNGTGQYSMYGQELTTCTACGGTGICSVCDGKGRV